KVAAYTYQALMKFAAARLNVPVEKLNVLDSVVSGGGKSTSYGELVEGQQLDLKIPVKGELPKPDPSGWVGMTTLDGVTVTGEPPLTPLSQCTVIGTSHPVPGIPDKVTGKTQWSCDVLLPECCTHA